MKKLLIFVFLFLFLAFPVKGQTTNPAKNPDVNLSLRSWVSVPNPPYGGLGLIDVTGPTDVAPSLTTLIQGNSTPNFTSLYQINGWDFYTNQKTSPIAPDYSTNWGVTLAGLSTNPGDTIQVPAYGPEIGNGNQVMILYATPTSITINYTASGFAQNGYTIHLENFNVDPSILAFYQANAEGRTQLPALPAFAKLGTASGKEILVAIRDSGSFMDPRSRKDWWQTRNGTTLNASPQLLNLVRSQAIPSLSSGRFRTFAEESEEPCSQTEISAGPGDNPTYHKADGPNEPVFKSDSGLNFATSVRGSHCGQTKSQPVALQEIAPFSLFEGPKCKNVQWLGELEVSPDNTSNFTIPFAKEIADHWAGKGFEHYVAPTGATTIPIIGPIIGPVVNPILEAGKEALLGKTGSAMPAGSGVLTKLLAQDYQDQLKCSFINYVKKKGGLSAYAGAKIQSGGLLTGEIKLTDLTCPPSVYGDYDVYRNQTWRKNTANLWSKIGLFPDEKSKGKLRFAVCEDKLYDLDTGYPSVFRLGLAANELYKTFTAKENLDSYYQANNEQSGFAKPLDQNKNLAQKPSPKNSLLAFAQNLGQRIKNLVSQVFAQATGTISVTPHAEVVNGKLVYSIEVNLPPGVDGHINVEIAGTGKGTVNYVPPGGTIYLGTPGSNATAIIDGWPTFNPGDAVQFQIKCDDCHSKDQGRPISVSCTSSISGQTNCKPLASGPPPTPASCGPNQCCETGSCKVSCTICNLAQKNPSDTTVWPRGYGFNKVQIGNPEVDFTFKIPDWSPGQPLPPECRVTNAKGKCGGGGSCIPGTYCDTDFGVCIKEGDFANVSCEKTHDRAVDVYNQVPFLASAWKQAGDASLGFLNTFKSRDLSGVGLRNNINGCTAETTLVLDPSGNFGTNPAYSEVTYSFNQSSGDGVRVNLSSPGRDQKGKITFYRLGGLCNADNWVSQRLLLP